MIRPLAIEDTKPNFRAIAAHLGISFICAGSFPAFKISQIYCTLLETEEKIDLVYNDIDVYYGRFGEGDINRINCSYTNIDGIDKEVNLIECSNLNTKYLQENCDINAVAVYVHVHVENKVVRSSEWTVSPEYWHFLLVDRTLQSWRAENPAQTLVRLAFKSYQMKLPFSTSFLSLLDGILFVSHQKKIHEMESKWKDYPFSEYKLKQKTGKSFYFIRFRVECACGRKGNLRCVSQQCAPCCRKDSNVCKVHNSH